MQITVSFEFIYDIGNRCIPNMKTFSIVYHWNQNRNKEKNKGCYLSVYLYLIIKLCMFL